VGSSSTLERLVRGAEDLYSRPAAIPRAVLDRAALQHLSAAGAVRSTCAAHFPESEALPEGRVPRVGGPDTTLEDAVAWHAGLAGWLELDDHLLRGRSCAATAAAAWGSVSASHTWSQVLAATVAGNELAGRLGLATLPGAPEWGHGPGTSAAVALVCGLLAGKTGIELVGSVAAALPEQASMVSNRPFSRPLDGCDAGAARRGVRALNQSADPSAFDRSGGLLEQCSWHPLMGALQGMGTVWLTDTITYRSRAIAPAGQTAVEAVAEILRRHVKAADKRLRVDQVERIVVRVPAAAAGLGVRGAMAPSSIPWSVPNALGVLVAQHALGAEDLTPAVLQRRSENIAHVADRVEWVVDRGLGARALSAQLAVLGPLFGDFGWKDARQMLLRTLAGQRHPGGPSRERIQVWAELARRLWTQRGATAQLGELDISAWQLHLPVEVELYTTRGGRWPERRSLPEGGPGSSWQQTVAAVVERFDTVDGSVGGADILATDPSGSGRAVVERLLGRTT
jgi:2-methylcitrate dehydratase PrpD